MLANTGFREPLPTMADLITKMMQLIVLTDPEGGRSEGVACCTDRKAL